jgi:hypothetical protein
LNKLSAVPTELLGMNVAALGQTGPRPRTLRRRDPGMSAQHAEQDGPLIPQPVMTREALRGAIRRVALPRLAELDR